MSDKATIGGGCFWCLEAVYEQLKGVERVVSGYAGGPGGNPSYEAVCSGTTGHAEVVQVTYDPAIVSYDDLLRIFFAMHDPTTLNRQGADAGTQYRSVIFTHDAAQAAAAKWVVEELSGEGLWSDPIVTQIEPLTEFWPAEPYHQGYYRNNPMQPYCAFTVAPKVAKFRTKYFDRLKIPR